MKEIEKTRWRERVSQFFLCVCKGNAWNSSWENEEGSFFFFSSYFAHLPTCMLLPLSSHPQLILSISLPEPSQKRNLSVRTCARSPVCLSAKDMRFAERKRKRECCCFYRRKKRPGRHERNTRRKNSVSSRVEKRNRSVSCYNCEAEAVVCFELLTK